MSRLPIVSSDGDAWGTILNDFLSVAHNSNGTLKNLFVNLKDYCAIDGMTDDSAGFTTAYTLAASQNMGLFHPGGTLVKGNDTLVANVPIVGAGPGVSIIKLKNGANTDLFSAYTASINLAGAALSGSATGVIGASIKNLTLDGNKANQSGGPSYPIRGYGYAFTLQDVGIKNGYSGGILWDWNNTFDPAGLSVINHWSDVEVHDNNGIGIQIGGPSDCQWERVNVYTNGSHNVHFAPNAVSPVLTSCHVWKPPTGASAVGILLETGGAQFVNCESEGSDTSQLVILGSNTQWSGGAIFSDTSGTRNGTGVQLGQAAGSTPLPGQILQSGGLTTATAVSGNYLQALILNCQGGAINEVSTSFNTYICQVYQTTSSAIISGGGYPGVTSTALLRVGGLTPDGSPGKGGTFQVADDSFNGLVFRNSTSGNTIFAIDSHSGAGDVALYHGALLAGFSDAGSTETYSLDAATGAVTTSGMIATHAQIATGQSATAPAITNGWLVGTLTVGAARVAPTGNVTGTVLEAGVVGGQEVCVINESAFTVTFDVAGTSHVADGTSCVIAANRKMDFTWNSSAAKWYRS